MSKKKSRTRSYGLLPWLSAKLDCRDGRFVQVGMSLLMSEQFQSLTDGAKVTYLCMACESGGKREFAFTESDAKKYGISPRSLRNHIAKLREQGFIVAAQYGHAGRKNEYHFSQNWKNPTEQSDQNRFPQIKQKLTGAARHEKQQSGYI